MHLLQVHSPLPRPPLHCHCHYYAGCLVDCPPDVRSLSWCTSDHHRCEAAYSPLRVRMCMCACIYIYVSCTCVWSTSMNINHTARVQNLTRIPHSKTYTEITQSASSLRCVAIISVHTNNEIKSRFQSPNTDLLGRPCSSLAKAGADANSQTPLSHRKTPNCVVCIWQSFTCASVRIRQCLHNVRVCITYGEHIAIMFTRPYVFINKYTHIYILVCMYVYMQACAYGCMHGCTYLRKHSVP